ncbi:GNAT family N-acetyltransferase [Candidatus Woesearchaeota archaeon]|nr:GNAT family N-acetyltransferase [Candidatus Woesearchaeota archaeon]
MKKGEEKVITQYIKGLFHEDPTPQGMSDEKIKRTIRTLLKYKEKGTIMVFESGKEIIGYSILINFWSNEYGGNIVYIDELFVKKEWRGKGVATNFIQYLVKKKVNKAVSLFLEVTPQNKAAEELYKRRGFSIHKNKRMEKKI